MTNNPDLEIPEKYKRTKTASPTSSEKETDMPITYKKKSETALVTTAENAEVLPPNTLFDVERSQAVLR